MSCGYNTCARALHWHHIDPNCKSNKLSRAISGGRPFVAMEELSHCILLCANCHAEAESSLSAKGGQ